MDYRLLIVKDREFFDATALVTSLILSGRRDAASRSLRVQLLDHKDLQSERVGIDVEMGHQCVFFHNDRELFRGMFMRQEQNQGRVMTLTAYDNGIYLANNKDSFSYMYKAASFIFRDVCNRFSIPYSGVAETGYIIDELPRPMTTGFDAICDALRLTYNATGRRYSVVCEGEKLGLIRRIDNVVQWVIGAGENVSSYSYNRSIEKVKTRIKFMDRDHYLAARRINSDLERRIGVFQDAAIAERKMSYGKLAGLVDAMLKEKGEPEKLLTVEALGNSEIISGRCVFVKIPHLGLDGSFYVESDRHVFQNGMHTMQLSLAPVSKLDLG